MGVASYRVGDACHVYVIRRGDVPVSTVVSVGVLASVGRFWDAEAGARYVGAAYALVLGCARVWVAADAWWLVVRYRYCECTSLVITAHIIYRIGYGCCA